MADHMDAQGVLFFPGEGGKDHPASFPVPTSPLARTGHPSTSHAAAAELLGSDELGAAQAEALALLRANPGATANELSRIAGYEDSRRIPRRLSELAANNLAYTDGVRTDPRTGKAGQRWWPTDSGG